MPSGAKKRKAARKKKQKESNINPSTNNPKDNDDLKSQDGKGSDGNSPVYHEHDGLRNPSNDGSEELEERGPLTAQPRASDVESSEEVPRDVKIDHVLGGEEGGGVLVERGLESEESSESTNASFEHIETAKESHYQDGNGYDISKGESFTQKRGLESEEISKSKNVSFEHIETANGGDTSKGESFPEKNSEDGYCNSVEEAIASHELVKSIDSSPSKMISITEMAPVKKTVNSASDPAVTSIKAMNFVSEVEKSDSGSVLLEKSVVHPAEATNFAMKVNEDNAYPLTNQNVTTSSVKEPKPKACDNEVLASLSASPFTKFTNGAENIKDSKTAEQSENQPRVASAPNVVKKTSWLSCCGLFEILLTSNR